MRVRIQRFLFTSLKDVKTIFDIATNLIYAPSVSVIWSACHEVDVLMIQSSGGGESCIAFLVSLYLLLVGPLVHHVVLVVGGNLDSCG